MTSDSATAPERQVQFLCADCGRYSEPVTPGDDRELEMVDDLVDGCWVVAGLVCPGCNDLPR